MKNDTYVSLKQTAARIYQKRTEALAHMKRVPEEKRDDEFKYRQFWNKEAVQNMNRKQGSSAVNAQTGKFEGVVGQGFLNSLHALMERPGARHKGGGRFIIPSMSCLKREDKK